MKELMNYKFYIVVMMRPVNRIIGPDLLASVFSIPGKDNENFDISMCFC